MSEQSPLLPTTSQNNEDDRGPAKNIRERTAQTLEGSILHKIIIVLTVIDTACVLADLGYTLLSPNCQPPSSEEGPVWLEVLSLISLTITFVFLVEIPLTLWSLGFEHYNPAGSTPHASLHLFDAFIIITTFVLEFVLRGKERELAELLIVLRLWRLIKLVGGVAVGAGEIEDDNAKKIVELREHLKKTRTELESLKEENTVLRRRLGAS